MDNYNDAFALDSQGNIAVRTVSATEQQNLPYNYNDVFTLTTDGKLALRTVSENGGGSGGLTSVSHDTTLTGNGTSTSPLGLSTEVLSSISQNADDIATLQTDVGDLGDNVNSLNTEKQNVQTIVNDSASTTITLANANANTVYHYGTLDSLTITAADTSDLETVIWFTPSASLTAVSIPSSLLPMNAFSPVAGKLSCISILNGTVVYGSVL